MTALSPEEKRALLARLLAERSAEPERAPLSFAQQRLWFLQQLEPGSAAYNVGAAVTLSGALEIPVLAGSLQCVVDRHETLRTTFAVADGKPVQVIAKGRRHELPVVDLSRLPAAVAEGTLQRLAGEEQLRPFDLERGPLLRSTLLLLGPARFALFLYLHHIVSDGWSMRVLIGELSALYAAGADGRPATLPPLPIQYSDFAAWQRERLSGSVLQAQIDYWKARLAGSPEVIDWPLDHPRPALATSRGGRLEARLGGALTERLRACGRPAGATLFMGLLAAWQALLARWCGQGDILVGTPIAGRGRRELEGLIGVFANTLVIRTDLSDSPGFAALLARTREATLGAFDHQDLPFERVVEELQPARSTSHSPIFQALFVLQDPGAGEGAGGGRLGSLALATLPAAAEAAQFDLAFHAFESGDEVALSLVYNRDLFDPPTIGRLAESFGVLLAALLDAPETPLAALPVTGAAGRHQLLCEWNDTATARAEGGTVADRIVARAAARPDRIALAFADTALSYGELERRSGQLARHLTGRDIGFESRVGIACERSLELLIGLLGILRAGAAYVPIDPDHPAERIAAVIEDGQVALLLCQHHLAGGLPASVPVLRLDADWAQIAAEGAALPAAPGDADGLIYVLFTSGSTGRPKGVMNTHRAVANRLLWMLDAYGLDADHRVMQKTPVSFDVSAWELFCPLLAGACLVVARPGGHTDPAYLARLIVREQVTALHFVPPLLRIFLEQPGAAACRSLRWVVASGEALPAEVIARFAERLGGWAELYNLYGPTEAAIEVSAWPARAAPREGAVPIGRPIENLRLHVLDRDFQPAPLGTPGELAIGGLGLARGYSTRPELTAASFVPDPVGEEPGGRLYHTGDRVRHLPDGNLVYLGRLDHQVKVRGFRIELGEIEAALARHPAVRQAVVLAERQGGDVRLRAFVVPAAAGGEPEPSALREFLRGTLPEYMLPAAFVGLAEFPLLPNGKVDRRALAALAGARGATAGPQPPRSRLERQVAAIWRQVLGSEREVGADDSFFDLGGHSLRMAEVQARLAAELGVELSMVELFQHATVAALAGHLAFRLGIAEAPPESAAAPVVAAAPAPPVGEIRDIAVVAVAGRFPGARGIEEFWANLRAGVESIATLSREEMLADGIDPRLLERPEWVPAWGSLADIDLFDAGLFGFNPREAEILDPQHRLFLECAWEALERAGCDPATAGRRIGVFAGTSMSTYALNNLASRPELVEQVGSFQAMLANDKDYLATRVAYHLGLRGPAVAVQSACSTSLVAVALACQAIRAGQCDMALAGGVSVTPQQHGGYLYEPGHIASPDGHCRPFDHRAAGTVGGSGVGVVALVPLAAAVAAGEPVLAVIRGVALNNDGADKVGFTAPGVSGQVEVIAAAHAAAGVEPGSIGYVEAHGTGTALGDPIEVAALNRAFTARGPLPPASCFLGSVKSNFGHLDAAAGVAGMIKAVLAVERGEIPPSLHFEAANPRIDFSAGPFVVARELSPWPMGGKDLRDCKDVRDEGREPGGSFPRRAGVSSFGLGGTNAHVVLEEAPAREPSGPSRLWQLFVLSAADRPALERASGRLADWLAAAQEPPADIAFTLARGRRALPFRRAVVARDAAEAGRRLAARDSGWVRSGHAAGRRPVAFLFPGQGAQHPGMAEDLYRGEPAFRAEIDRAAELLEIDLPGLLFPRAEEREVAAERLAQTRFAQPALFAVEYALARLWMSWGVRPEGMLGHSVGEYVAACLAGVWSLADALAVVAARGRLAQEMAPGAMVSVALPAAELESYLGDGIALAAVNAPGLSVLAGPEAPLAALAAELEGRGVETRRLRTSHAFHSPALEPMREPFLALLRERPPGAPRLPFVSNRTGTWIEPAAAADPDYWVEHLLAPVRFADGLATLLAEPDLALLEVGPGQSLSALARQHGPAAAGRVIAASLPRPNEARSAAEAVLDAAGRLWSAGADLDWGAFYAGEVRRRVLLPTYPFARERYWIEARPRALGAEGPGWYEAPAGEGGGDGGCWIVRGDPALGQALAATLGAAEGDAPGVVFVPDPAAQGAAVGELIGLVRSVAARRAEILGVVVFGAFGILPEERVDPGAAALAAAFAALVPEMGARVCRLVDAGRVEGELDLALVVAELSPHPWPLSRDGRGEPLRDGRARGLERVALRGGRRFVDRPPALPSRPSHERPAVVADFVAPASPVEARIAGIWEELLGISRVGAQDDFFELGGHSLLATRLLSRLRDAFGVELTLEALFAVPTPAGLAAQVEALAAGTGARLAAPPLVAGGEVGPAPLSFAQERLWFIDRFERGSLAYNVPLAVRLSGGLEPTVLEATIAAIAARQGSLRTVFREVGEEVVQVVAPAVAVGLPLADLSALPAAVRDSEARRLASVEIGRPFDLERGPLFRTLLLRLASREHAVVATLHHSISDGWSLGILVREIGEIYPALAADLPVPLPPLPVQYTDFARWQRGWLRGKVLAAEVSFWRGALSDLPELLDLPLDRPRPAVRSEAGATLPVAWPAALAGSLAGLARAQGATLFMVVLAGFFALLSRYSRQQRVAVGTPLAGRNRLETEGLIGFFVNTLVLAGDLAGGPTFAELLGRVRRATLAAFDHQDLPFEKLVEELAPVRSLAHTPLFQVLFALQNTPGAPLALPGLTLAPFAVEPGGAQFDLSLALWEGTAGLAGDLEYNRDLFDRPTMARLAGHLGVLLAAAVRDPGAPVADLPLASAAELHQVAWEWNDTAWPAAPERLLHEGFEAQAASSPGLIAVLYDDQHLSYGELDRLSAAVARRLLAAGVGADDRVALCVTRRPPGIAAILGILRAGAAYVPLDPAYPDARLAYMLRDSGARALVTERAFGERFAALSQGLAPAVLDLEDVLADPPGGPLARRAAPESLAYVLYTSGSTGEPKGVAVSHRAAVRHLHTMSPYAGATAAVALLFASWSFDLSVDQIFGGLTAGGALALRGDELWTAEEMSARLYHYGVTVSDLPTAYWQQWVEDTAGPGPDPALPLAALIVAGEAMAVAPARHWPATPGGAARLLNGYGPTEAVVTATFLEVDAMSLARAGAVVPIGRPHPYRSARVLSPAGLAQPPGVPGELFLGSDLLARGYLGRPVPTAERFVPDPWGEPGGRLYRTGDLVRALPDGVLDFLGRLDGQVKIRGYRIELGEIEAALAGHPGVQQAAVAVHELAGQPALVAFLVPRPGRPAGEEDDWGGWLRGRLPEPLIPQRFLTLDALPLTVNGKVDQRALGTRLAAAAADGAADPARSAPRGALETAVAAAFAEVLGGPPPGRDDGFFELGGHSLAALRLAARLGQRLGREVPVRMVFAAPTVARLAAALGEGEAAAAVPDPALARPPLVAAAAAPGEVQRAPLSFSQQRLWFVDRATPGAVVYNIPFALRFAGRLDVGALAASLARLAARHESLRLAFAERDGEPEQVVVPAGAAPVPLAVIDLSALGEATAAEEARVAAAVALGPFDLSRAPLWRLALVARGREEHLAVGALHHAIADGWSVGLFIAELGGFYRELTGGGAAPRPPLPVQYTDFARWQRSWLTDAFVEREIAFFRAALEGTVSPLPLPADRRRPAERTTLGGRSWLTVSPATTAALARLARERGATLFMALFSAYAALLGRLAGEERFAIGTPVAGRTLPELEGLIGLFVNTLALPARLDGDPSFGGLVGGSRDRLLAALAHGDLPFDRLVEAFEPRRDLAHSPVFQVLFVLQNAPGGELALPGLRLDTVQLDNPTAKYDLSLAMTELPGEIAGELEWSADLFDPPTAERLAGWMGRLLDLAAAAPDRPLSQLPLLSEAEQAALLAMAGAPPTADELAGLARLEAVLRAHPRVAEAVVFRTDDGAVAAAVVPEEGGVAAAELRRFLGERLADAALPEVWVLVTELPRTWSGRLDRRALAAAAAGAAGGADIPEEEIEGLLAELGELSADELEALLGAPAAPKEEPG